jgi:hypothetical protein
MRHACVFADQFSTFVNEVLHPVNTITAEQGVSQLVSVDLQTAEQIREAS